MISNIWNFTREFIWKICTLIVEFNNFVLLIIRHVLQHYNTFLILTIQLTDEE